MLEQIILHIIAAYELQVAAAHGCNSQGHNCWPVYLSASKIHTAQCWKDRTLTDKIHQQQILPWNRFVPLLLVAILN